MQRNAIEFKVIAAAAGAGAGDAIARFLLWLSGVIWWHAPSTADLASGAMAAVPVPVSGLITVAITASAAALAGYVAPHTSRSAPKPLGAPLPLPPAPNA